MVGDRSSSGGGSTACSVDSVKLTKKRTGRVSTTAAQAIADGVTSSVKRITKSSSDNRRSGKRARQADADVVVFEQDGHAAITRTTTPGARVAVKPESQMAIPDACVTSTATAEGLVLQWDVVGVDQQVKHDCCYLLVSVILAKASTPLHGTFPERVVFGQRTDTKYFGYVPSRSHRTKQAHRKVSCSRYTSK